MNEQITEIAKQSGLWFVTEREDLCHIFAQLIIQECMRIDIENRDAAPAVEIATYFGMTDNYQKLLKNIQIDV